MLKTCAPPSQWEGPSTHGHSRAWWATIRGVLYRVMVIKRAKKQNILVQVADEESVGMLSIQHDITWQPRYPAWPWLLLWPVQVLSSSLYWCTCKGYGVNSRWSTILTKGFEGAKGCWAELPVTDCNKAAKTDLWFANGLLFLSAILLPRGVWRATWQVTEVWKGLQDLHHQVLPFAFPNIAFPLREIWNHRMASVKP